MKISKRTPIVVGGIASGIFFGIQALSNYYSQKAHDQLTKLFDDLDQDLAIKKLSEFRGRISEVKFLSCKNISQSTLLDELRDITASKYFPNPYLRDFVFFMPDTSDIGKICDELIAQIDDQIYTIEYGTKG